MSELYQDVDLQRGLKLRKDCVSVKGRSARLCVSLPFCTSCVCTVQSSSGSFGATNCIFCRGDLKSVFQGNLKGYIPIEL